MPMQLFEDYPYTLVFEGYNEYLGGDQFDSNGNLKLTNTGAASLRKSVATTVTVTVTNADGSSATASFDFTLTRA